MDVFVVLLLSGFSVPTASLLNIYYFVNENMTWDDANTYCMMEHTALAQITHLDNFTALKKTPTRRYTGKAWIGLHKALQWTWLDGQPDSSFTLSGAPLYTDYCAYMKHNGQQYYSTCTETKFSVCFNGSHYLVDEQNRTWNDAKTSCECKQSTLLQINEKQINPDLHELLSSLTQDVWIGLRTSLVWIWSETNQINAFMNWETGQPDNQNGDELCAAVVVENETWTDEPCDAQYPFFCYGIYKAKKTVVSMNIQTGANLKNPHNSATLMQQLQATLTKQGVTDFKLTWMKQPVKKSKMKTKKPCSP